MLVARARITTCPQCHRSLPDFGTWPAWCPDCGWGLDAADQSSAGSSRFERWWRRRAAAAEDSELQRLLADPTLLARRHSRSTAIYVAAIAVHVVTVALLAVAVWVMTTGIVPVLKVGAGIVIFGLVAITFPVHRLRPSAAATRSDAPTTLSVAAVIAERVGVTAPSRVRVTSYHDLLPPTSGRVLTVDTVCWRVLGDGGRRALLAHQLAHYSGRDPRRLMFVTLASETLDGWVALLRPDPRSAARRQARISRRRSTRAPGMSRGVVGLSEMILPIVIAPIYAAVLALGWVLRKGGTVAGLRAELYADAVAVEVGGASGAAQVRELIDGQIAEVAVGGDPTTPVAELPDLERERRRRTAVATRSRIDTMHPTFDARLQMLAVVERQSPTTRPPAAVSSADIDTMTRELAALRRPDE